MSKSDGLVDREQLLDQFGLMTEDELAVLFGVNVQSLRNRKPNELPPFTKTGARRLFFKDDVVEFMRAQRGRTSLAGMRGQGGRTRPG